MKLMYMLAVLLALLALNGCENEQAKKAAADAGFREGKEEGYSEGYKNGRSAGYVAGKKEGAKAGHKEGYAVGLAEGLQKYKPGNASMLSGPQREAYNWVVRLGVIKLFFALLWLSLLVMLHSREHMPHLIGKVVCVVIGTAGTVSIGGVLGVAAAAEDVLLQPSVKGLGETLVMMAAGAVIAYLGLELLFRLVRWAEGPVIEGWLIILLSAMTTMLWPMVWAIWHDIPDVSGYLAADLFTGPLIGILYWIAHGFLSGKFEDTMVGALPVMVGDYSRKAEPSGRADPEAVLRPTRVKRANGEGLGPR